MVKLLPEGPSITLIGVQCWSKQLFMAWKLLQALPLAQLFRKPPTTLYVFSIGLSAANTAGFAKLLPEGYFFSGHH